MLLPGSRKALEAPIEKRAHLVAAGDVAIRNGDVLSRARVSQSEGALRTNRVVPGGIHAAVRYAHIAAAIDVDSIPVRIDLQVVDSQVVDTGRQDRKMAAREHRKIAQDHIVAVLQGERLVADAGRLLARKI